MELPKNTFETIMNRMLSRIPNNVDKREGSIIWDALAPAALEIESLYFTLMGIVQENNVLICSRPSLINKARERGLAPIPASEAIIEVKFNVDVNKGDKFQYKDLVYKVLEKSREEGSYYKLQCESKGVKGNISNGKLLNINRVAGVTEADIIQVLIYGRDDEDTEVLRQRYLKSFTEQAYGGNITDYELKTLSISGVGAVKVTPVWNGGGTVKLTILDSNFNKANDELINKVKDTLDPKLNAGKGKGIAPIGHDVTVVTVEPVNMNIKFTIPFKNNDNFNNRKEEIKKTIETYFLELKKEWSYKDIKVSPIILQARILANIPNVDDITKFTINGSSDTIKLEGNQIPVLGEVSTYDI